MLLQSHVSCLQLSSLLLLTFAADFLLSISRIFFTKKFVSARKIMYKYVATAGKAHNQIALFHAQLSPVYYC